MLASLALVLAGHQGSPDALPKMRSAPEVARLLRGFGYGASVGYPGASKEAPGVLTVSRGETRALAILSPLIGMMPDGESLGLPWILLQIEFAMPPKTPFTAIDAVDQASRVAKGPTFEPHLGHTVTETLSIPLTDVTRRSVKEAVERFFASGSGLARRLGVPYVAVREPHGGFDDRTLLDRADRVSLDRAVRSWGWATRKSLPNLYGGWDIPIRVDGKSLHLQPQFLQGRPMRGTVRLVRYDALSESSRSATASNGVFDTGHSAQGGPPLVADAKTLLIAPEIALGELRRRIEAFARKR